MEQQQLGVVYEGFRKCYTSILWPNFMWVIYLQDHKLSKEYVSTLDLSRMWF